jgi:CheY-like chemotaxis protein/HPt (histidine-containing phosphotransfer) domain-containing protein
VAVGLVGTVQDVTQRVQVEAELRAAKQAADAASHAKSDFLARMSHEIRTPMNAVMGMNRLLLETSLNSDQRHYAELANESAQALLSLIDDILDISRLEAGKLEPEHIPFNPVMILDNVVSMLTPRAQEKGTALRVTMLSNVQRWFRGDPMRLRQVLINLVNNALKFTDKGSVTIEASVLQEAAGIARLRFEVVDTGIGISEEAQGSLFQTFTQADGSITRRFGGSGLGLAICKQLVELWDGKIGCTSKVGAGSRFWFEISLPATEAPTAESESSQIPSDPIVRRRNLTLLLVEDNPINQQVAQLVLASSGHKVDVVDNGLSAIEAVRAKRYDVVLMDVQMPGLDGMETTRRIRALPQPASKVPIIAVTANAMSGAREEYLAAGMNDYISKPFAPVELRAKIERLAAADGGSHETEILDATASLQTSEPPSFDPTRLDELKEMTGKAAFAGMVVGFAQGLEARIQRFKDLVEQTSWPEAAREAHDIGSISGSVGAARLSSLARELEAICKAGKQAECRSVLPTFANEASEALRALKAYRAAA